MFSLPSSLPGKALATALALAAFSLAAQAQDKLLNASYDVSRELFKDINTAFKAEWSQQHPQGVEIQQTHGGSSKQARAIIEGLAADVVTFNQTTDIDALAKEKLVAKDWRQKLPHNASPYSSVTAFIVRKGNPKKIHDWNDLVRSDVQIALVNPKTGGNGRYTFLAAYAYALEQAQGDQSKARQFISTFYHNVPVLDTGGRGATTTFASRGIGDVLVTFESEIHLIQKELGSDQFEVIVPSVSVLAEFPVAVVESVTKKHGNQALAEAYLQFLFSEKAQDIAARNFYRPLNEQVAARYSQQFHATRLIDVEALFGGWSKAQTSFFADGALFDQIYTQAK